jgi:hypothetical protein
MTTVNVACAIIGGLQLGYYESGLNGPVGPIVLAGPQINAIGRSGAGVTAVPADFWTTWIAEFANWPPVLNGAVYQT